MEISKDTNALIISIVSLVFTSLWTVIWAIHVRFRDRIRARQLKLSEITNRFVKDGIQVRAKLPTAQTQVLRTGQQTWQPTAPRLGAQDAGYEVGEYLIALGATHPGKLWEVLTCGRASRLAPVEQPQNPLSPEEASLNAFKNNLPEALPPFVHTTTLWACSLLAAACYHPRSCSGAAGLPCLFKLWPLCMQFLHYLGICGSSAPPYSRVPRGRWPAWSGGWQGSGTRSPASGKPMSCQVTSGAASLAAASASGSTAQTTTACTRSALTSPTTTGSGSTRTAQSHQSRTPRAVRGATGSSRSSG